MNFSAIFGILKTFKKLYFLKSLKDGTNLQFYFILQRRNIFGT